VTRTVAKFKICIGISACLLGQRVRYDGGHKHAPALTQALAQHFTLLPLCPEVAIGLGVPRARIALTKLNQQIRAVRDSDNLDVTTKLARYADAASQQYDQLCGYVFKSKSPSCGLSGVKRYAEDDLLDAAGRGIFAARFTALNPALPLIEENADQRALAQFISEVRRYADSIRPPR